MKNHESAQFDVIGRQADVTIRLPRRERFPRWHRMVAVSVACVAFAAPCAADTSSIRSVIDDTKLYFTAPLRWDENNWLQFGVALAAVGVAHEYDDTVRRHFVAAAGAHYSGNDTHSLRDAMPTVAMVAGTWAAAKLLDSRAGYEEGRVMLEAGALSALSTTVLKTAIGRSRPTESNRVNDWGNSGDSFPSMHVSAAFAVGTVLAESGGNDHRWLRRTIGYGLATATAYARVHGNVHWLSDTVAGAAIGIATAEFALNRRDEGHRRSAVMLTPMDGGVMLTYSLPLE
jgi:membrane-associated phospholipid phosphatase